MNAYFVEDATWDANQVRSSSYCNIYKRRLERSKRKIQTELKQAPEEKLQGSYQHIQMKADKEEVEVGSDRN